MINKIKSSFFIRKEGNKATEPFFIKSEVHQLVDYLEKNKDINKFNLFYEMQNKFDFSSLFELVYWFKIKPDLLHHHAFLKEYNFSGLNKEFDSFLLKIQHRRTHTEFLAYTIRMKRDLMLLKDYINVEGLISVINTKIIEQSVIVFSSLKHEVTLKESLGFFFVYPKDEASNYFQLFLRNYLGGLMSYREIAFGIDRYIYDLFLILDLDFIPDVQFISNQNFKEDNIFEYDVNKNITYNEILKISRIDEYFSRSLPLADLKESELINIKSDIKHNKVVENILSMFFKEIIKVDLTPNGKDVFSLFWSSCTVKIANHEPYELEYARLVLNEKFSNDSQLILCLISVFKLLKKDKRISFLPKKLPNILISYFQENCNYKEKTIYDFLTRKDVNNERFYLAYDDIKSWYLNKCH